MFILFVSSYFRLSRFNTLSTRSFVSSLMWGMLRNLAGARVSMWLAFTVSGCTTSSSLDLCLHHRITIPSSLLISFFVYFCTFPDGKETYTTDKGDYVYLATPNLSSEIPPLYSFSARIRFCAMRPRFPVLAFCFTFYYLIFLVSFYNEERNSTCLSGLGCGVKALEGEH